MHSLPLVLIPGLNCTARLYRSQIAHLSRSRLIYVPDHAKDDTMAAIAARVLAVFDGPFDVAGLSMGGFIAFEVLRQAPDRVRKLALLDTNAVADPPAFEARRLSQISDAKANGMRGLAATLYTRFVHPARLEDEALKAEVIAMAEETGAEGFANQSRAIIGRADQRPSLGAVKAPTLVICGEQDVTTPPAQSQEIADGIPGAVLRMVPHCGHLSTMECPETVTRLFADWFG